MKMFLYSRRRFRQTVAFRSTALEDMFGNTIFDMFGNVIYVS